MPKQRSAGRMKNRENRKERKNQNKPKKKKIINFEKEKASLNSGNIIREKRKCFFFKVVWKCRNNGNKERSPVEKEGGGGTRSIDGEQTNIHASVARANTS